MGILPSALVNYLLRLGFSYGDKEIFTWDEMVKCFSLDRLNKSPAVFNPDKLIWVNSEHMKILGPRELLEHVRGFLDKECGKYSDEYLIEAIRTRQTKAQTLVELAEEIRFYCVEPKNYEEKGVKKFLKDSVREPLEYLYSRLEQTYSFSEGNLKKVFEDTMEKYQIKMVKLAQPVRIALTGKTVGPGIYEMLLVLGKEESLKRFRRLLNAVFPN